jgi:hypothetical protein
MEKHTYYQYPADIDKQMSRRNVFFTSAVAAGVTGGALLAAGAASAATIGLGAFAATKLIGGMTKKQGAPAAPKALPEAPSVDRAEIAAKESIDKKRRAVARNKSVFTGPLGLQPEEKSGIALKTLTGV